MGRKQTVQRNYNEEGNLISKEYSCCHEIKPVSEFSKNKGKADGYQLKCKECSKQYREENREGLKEKQKQYREENKDIIRKQKKTI